ncbi:cobyric acid synthase [Desulfococcaceae bacterium HSG8]|nr:cobyric acid synthase [Desulfococcaceae bacterium HSG8]
MKNPSNIMFLGTGSDVGKSVTATAFCRILKNRGYRVAPFKAQNMSNNSFVTLEGGEIGRAQVAQAEACGLTPSVHMNPVLLKPDSEVGSQVVIQGQVFGNMIARDYYGFKPVIRDKVMESYRKLRQEYEAIVMEGAGACCEVNLRSHDIVNFEMALSAKAPVILVADIDRGGVFAQIIGSLEIISQEERDLVAGFIINKFRGDPDLFRTGVEYIESRTGKPVFGLVPVFTDFRIDTEDSMSLDKTLSSGYRSREFRPDRINIGVVRLPHISNFTDLEVLEGEPEVSLFWLTEPKNINRYDVIILPGSKSTISDMIWLNESGWVEPLGEYADKKIGWIAGLCGGFQMLGKEISDPHEIEGRTRKTEGLGLLDISTEIETSKVVKRSSGYDRMFNVGVCGYEIHMGRTSLFNHSLPFLELETGSDGAINTNGNVFGTYLHGLFDSGIFRKRFLARIAGRKGIPYDSNVRRGDYWEEKDKNYERLAEHFSEYTDTERVLELLT